MTALKDVERFKKFDQVWINHPGRPASALVVEDDGGSTVTVEWRERIPRERISRIIDPSEESR
jgi:hypothetical protein